MRAVCRLGESLSRYKLLITKRGVMVELMVLAAGGSYVYGAWRFWTGFRRTNFSGGRLPLTLMWPVLVIANKSYRQNFGRALKGQ